MAWFNEQTKIYNTVQIISWVYRNGLKWILHSQIFCRYHRCKKVGSQIWLWWVLLLYWSWSVNTDVKYVCLGSAYNAGLANVAITDGSQCTFAMCGCSSSVVNPSYRSWMNCFLLLGNLFVLFFLLVVFIIENCIAVLQHFICHSTYLVQSLVIDVYKFQALRLPRNITITRKIKHSLIHVTEKKLKKVYLTYRIIISVFTF